jgi:hypothetical protein
LDGDPGGSRKAHLLISPVVISAVDAVGDEQPVEPEPLALADRLAEDNEQDRALIDRANPPS